MDDVAWLIRVQVLTGMLIDAIEAAPAGDGLLDGEGLADTLRAVRSGVDRRLADLAPEAETSA
jgi:hypothetical protein